MRRLGYRSIIVSLGCVWISTGWGAVVISTPTPTPSPSQKARGTSGLLPVDDPLKPQDDKDVQADQKAIEKSRWIQPSPRAKPDTSATKTERSVTIEANCTDSHGMSHAASDPGYGACVQEMSRSKNRDKDSLDPHSDPGQKPSVGAGVNLKFGK